MGMDLSKRNTYIGHRYTDGNSINRSADQKRLNILGDGTWNHKYHGEPERAHIDDPSTIELRQGTKDQSWIEVSEAANAEGEGFPYVQYQTQ